MCHSKLTEVSHAGFPKPDSGNSGLDEPWKMVFMTNDSWECAEVSEAPQGWILATENGWGALVVWAAGPGNFLRVPKAKGDRFGSIVHRLPDGGEQREPSLLTEADLSSIDDDIDFYLADADLPPRPRGFDWYIRPPSSNGLRGGAFWPAVWAATTEKLPYDSLRPWTMKGPAKEAMARLCRG